MRGDVDDFSWGVSTATGTRILSSVVTSNGVVESAVTVKGGVASALDDRLSRPSSERLYDVARLLRIACGTEDRMIDPNRRLRAWLAAQGVRHEAVDTPGAHTWMVWRRNLASFVPLLFSDQRPG